MDFSGHYSYRRLLHFTLPSIVMLVFTSIYGVVDGFFVSNFVGKTPFAAVNFIYPLLIMLGSVGFMFGTGGTALISKTMGEGDFKKANETFSMLVWTSAILGVVLAALGFFLLRPVASAMGAEGEMLAGCELYGGIILLSLPFYVLQYEFQCLFATAGKPKLGLFVTVAAGVTNMALDALFTAVLPWGLVGAAAATALSQLVGGVIPLIYFGRKKSSLLRLTRFRFDFRALAKACGNGSSEFLSSVSGSLVSMLYNIQLLKYAGENGVAAYGVLMYVNMIFLAIFIGYSVGVAPVIGFQYGAGNRAELHSLLKKSLTIIGGTAVLMFAAGELLAEPLTLLYVGYDAELLALTLRAFSIFSFSFLLAGFSIFGSAFFTALNNGAVSAVISFLRTLVFQIFAVLTFPLLWDIDGIWLSIVGAEVMAVVVTVVFLFAKRKKYGY